MKLKLAAATLVLTTLTNFGAIALDQSLPSYAAVGALNGRVKSIGSDTLNNEMQLWAKGFMALYPNVTVEIEGKGSATAPPAMLEGAAQFGPMSRPMTAEELAAFEGKYGYRISSFRVAVDALAVYVNKDNPITCLTMQQLGQIFSSTLRATGGKKVRNWGDLGLNGDWATKPIALHGRNNLSGTFEFFREMALASGDYKPELKQEVGSEAVVEAVANDKYAIGYSGIGYKSDGVRAVPLASYFGAKCQDTSAESAYSGRYPIARYLNIYINKNPKQQLDPLRGEFVKYVLSKDGQIQTEKGGYYPITNEIREMELRKLGLAPLAN